MLKPRKPRFKTSYGDCDFQEIAVASIPVKGVFAVGNQKYVLTGKFQIIQLENSSKYGSEIQFNFMTTEEPRIEARSGKQRFSKLEIDVPTIVGQQMIRDAVKTFPRQILTLKPFES